VRIPVLISFLLGAGFAAQAQTIVTCSAASLTGTYSFTLTGRALSSPATITAVSDSVGTITFDGIGAVTATLAVTTGLGTVTTQTWSGTYAIPSSCTGSITFTSGNNGTFVLIPYNNGKSFTLTGQDSTYQYGGSGSPQPVACVNATFSGAYVFSGTGFGFASGVPSVAEVVSGLLQFDGAGNVAANWSVGTAAALTSDSGSGKYTVSSNCTATVTVTDTNNLPYTFSGAFTAADGSSATMVMSAAGLAMPVTAHSTFANPGLAAANAAGVSGGTPPGSLFSIYGTNLATNQGQAVTSPWPKTLGGASVTVNGETAYLSYADKGQVNAQMPLDIPPGVATVVVTVGTNVSNAVAALVPATAVPGVFIYGNNIAVAQNYPSYALNSAASPAPAGSVVIVYFTGGGPVKNGGALKSGTATPNNSYPTTETATATLGGMPATVEFAGLTPGFIGLYQANIVVPALAKGGHTLVLNIGGTNSNSTTIYTN